MRSISFNKYFISITAAILCLSSINGFAQSDPEPTSAPAFTQGQAAVILARRLGLFHSETGAPTQARAIQLLSARNVAPNAGWEADEELPAGDLARILVAALGLDGELSEDQLADDDDQPFIDLLIERYDVDVNQVVSSGNFRYTTATVGSGSESSDPLLTDPVNPTMPVDQDDLNTILDAIVGSQGTSGGQVGGSNSNITPSAP